MSTIFRVVEKNYLTDIEVPAYAADELNRPGVKGIDSVYLTERHTVSQFKKIDGENVILLKIYNYRHTFKIISISCFNYFRA